MRKSKGAGLERDNQGFGYTPSRQPTPTLRVLRGDKWIREKSKYYIAVEERRVGRILSMNGL